MRTAAESPEFILLYAKKDANVYEINSYTHNKSSVARKECCFKWEGEEPAQNPWSKENKHKHTVKTISKKFEIVSSTLYYNATMVECRMDYVYLYLSGTASTAIKVKGLSFKGLFKIIKNIQKQNKDVWVNRVHWEN